MKSKHQILNQFSPPQGDHNRLLGEKIIADIKHIICTGIDENDSLAMDFRKDKLIDAEDIIGIICTMLYNKLDEYKASLSNLETVVPDKVEERLEFEIFTNWAAKKGYIFHAGMWFIGSEDDDTTFLTSELFTLWKEEKK